MNERLHDMTLMDMLLDVSLSAKEILNSMQPYVIACKYFVVRRWSLPQITLTAMK